MHGRHERSEVTPLFTLTFALPVIGCFSRWEDSYDRVARGKVGEDRLLHDIHGAGGRVAVLGGVHASQAIKKPGAFAGLSLLMRHLKDQSAFHYLATTGAEANQLKW